MTKLCECGCGQPAPISAFNRTALGHVKGQPIRFIVGHNARSQTFSAETLAKLAALGKARRGENALHWKGDKASYFTIHEWLRLTHPKSGACEECGRVGKTDYAFLRHPEPPTRNREDYQELCRRCHIQRDRVRDERGQFRGTIPAGLPGCDEAGNWRILEGKR